MQKKVDTVLKKSMLVNIILVIFKMAIGYIGNSKAMIADGVNSISDLTTDWIAILGNHISHKPASKKHPFGYGQIEYLTSILVGLFILVMGINLLIQAVNNDISMPSNIVLIVSILVFLVKYSFSYYLLQKGEKSQNNILIASGLESKATAMTTLFVIIAFIFSRLTPYCSIYQYSDNVCTFAIGMYVIFVSFQILKENVIDIIGASEENETIINKIKKKILSYEEIINVNEIHLIKYGSYYSADIEITCKKNMKLKEVNEIVSKLKKRLCSKRNKIRYIKISVIAEE